MCQPERHLVGDEIFEHIENEAFLNRLLHRIQVKWLRQVAGSSSLLGLGPAAEDFQRLGFGRGSECEVGKIFGLRAAMHTDQHDFLG